MLDAEVEGLEAQLKACIIASFETRAAAYEEEVRSSDGRPLGSQFSGSFEQATADQLASFKMQRPPAKRRHAAHRKSWRVDEDFNWKVVRIMGRLERRTATCEEGVAAHQNLHPVEVSSARQQRMGACTRGRLPSRHIILAHLWPLCCSAWARSRQRSMWKQGAASWSMHGVHSFRCNASDSAAPGSMAPTQHGAMCLAACCCT